MNAAIKTTPDELTHFVRSGTARIKSRHRQNTRRYEIQYRAKVSTSYLLLLDCRRWALLLPLSSSIAASDKARRSAVFRPTIPLPDDG